MWYFSFSFLINLQKCLHFCFFLSRWGADCTLMGNKMNFLDFSKWLQWNKRLEISEIGVGQRKRDVVIFAIKHLRCVESWRCRLFQPILQVCVYTGDNKHPNSKVSLENNSTKRGRWASSCMPRGQKRLLWQEALDRISLSLADIHAERAQSATGECKCHRGYQAPPTREAEKVKRLRSLISNVFPKCISPADTTCWQISFHMAFKVAITAHDTCHRRNNTAL